MSIRHLLISIFLFASVIFLSHYKFSGHAIYGDGIDYWAYMPSVYLDHDIDFTNQYKHYFEPINNNLKNPKSGPVVMKTVITKTGKTDNVHPFGTAIIWFPAFLVADIIARIFSLPAQGYSDVYQILVGLWSIGVFVIGLWFNYKILFKLITDKNLSLLSVFAIFGTTTLLYYGAYDILNSHFASFTLVAIYWYVLLFGQSGVKKQIFLGGLIGLATLVRFQEVILLLPTFLYYLHGKQRFVCYINTFLVFVIFISPLFFIWQYLYGIPIPVQYLTLQTQTVRWNFLGNIFHPVYGIIRTPILLLALIGVKKFYRDHKGTFFLMALYFFMQFTLTVSLGYWFGSSYGARAYTSSLPFFSVLIAYFLKYLKQKFSFKFATIVIFLLTLLNMISLSSFVLFEKDVNSGQKRGLEEKTQLRINDLIENTKEYFAKYKI